MSETYLYLIKYAAKDCMYPPPHMTHDMRVSSSSYV